MTTSNPYSQVGLVIPHKTDSLQEWCVPGPGAPFHSQDFLHVSSPRDNLQLVQSIATKQLFMIKTVRKTADPNDTNAFLDDVPPEIRVSVAPQAIVQLPRTSYFPNLVMWQEWSDTHWALFMQYYNGGTLRDVIDDYSAREEPVPEHFIWHVIEQLGEALVYLHLGRPYGTCGPGAASTPVPGWRPAYHRDINDTNTYLHYPPAGRSQILKARFNAFPQLVLGDFGESAVQGDNPAKIQLGVPPASSIYPVLEGWTDIYQFGRVIRRLCMAHVPERTPSSDQDNGDDEDDDEVENNDDDGHGDDGQNYEDQGDEDDHSGTDDDSVPIEDDTWDANRPDTHTLQFSNTFNVTPIYSNALINLLQAFERPNMATVGASKEPHLVPTIAWVARTLLPAARNQLQQIRSPAVPSIAHFQPLDVSMTRPTPPRLFVVVPGSEETMRGLKRVRDESYGSGEFSRPRPKIRRLQMAPPNMNRNDGGGSDVEQNIWENLT